MRIATWNVERLKHRRNLSDIILACEQARADILVLTETDEQVRPAYRYSFHTPKLAEIQPDYYRPFENRVSIYTNYECIGSFPTYDKYTALCVELKTELGNLLVYGTIMGIYGNRLAPFKDDLVKQTEDFKRLSAGGRNLCIAGDYNLSFSDNYYYTTFGREAVLRSFSDNHIKLLSGSAAWCIDHVAVSDSFVNDAIVTTEEWNTEKSLSDHKGTVIEIIAK